MKPTATKVIAVSLSAILAAGDWGACSTAAPPETRASALS